jgi:hypothetical protein
VAQSAPFQYEEAKSDAWRIRVRGYLIGACPEIAPVLNWAEQRGGNEIDQGDAEFTTTRSLNHSIMGEADKVVLSGLVWKFLQLCCIISSHASTTFQAAQPELNGLEVWRSLIWEINQGRSSRALLLRSGVQEPPLVKDFKDVSTALNAYDIVLRDYKAAGGQRPGDQELKQSFLSSLPETLQRDLVLKAACPEPYEAFKTHVHSTIAFAMQCAGRSRGRGAHLSEPEPVVENFEELEVAGGISDELLAFVRKFDNKRRAAAGASGKVQPTARRPASEAKCANCLKTGHVAADCRGAKVEQSPRLCFDCNKLGHQARNCPNEHKGAR